MNFGFQIFESLFATEEAIEDKEIHTPLSFWQRIFNPDPYATLWTMTKTEIIQVKVSKPAMYRVLDKFIVHPELMPGLLEAMKSEQSKSNVFRW